jgi:hypothetical protein
MVEEVVYNKGIGGLFERGDPFLLIINVCGIIHFSLLSYGVDTDH